MLQYFHVNLWTPYKYKMLFEEFPEDLKRKYMIVYNVCLYHFVNIYYNLGNSYNATIRFVK